MSWSTSELRVRLAPLNRFKPSSKIFYWPFQGGTSFVDLLCFCSVLCLLCFVRVCLYVLRGHLLGKGWPLGSRLWCLLWVCHFPIGILGQVWYLIVSIPDLCNLTYLSWATVGPATDKHQAPTHRIIIPKQTNVKPATLTKGRLSDTLYMAAKNWYRKELTWKSNWIFYERIWIRTHCWHKLSSTYWLYGGCSKTSKSDNVDCAGKIRH